MSRTSRLAVIGLLTAACGVSLILAMGATPANPPVKTEPPWDSPQTRTQFMRSCGDCHSNETVWPWYSRVPPASILVARDVREGRQKLNASEWDTRPQDTRELSEVMQQGEMPPAMYVVIHPDAVLSNADRQALLKGLTATFGVGHGGR